jgi:hypothetical protein
MPSPSRVAETISMQVMVKAPSPTMANTSRSGLTSLAPMAAGTA